MKNFLIALCMVCFVAFASNAQTTPAAQETKKETVKTETTNNAPADKKHSCCRKGMTPAECKQMSAAECKQMTPAECKKAGRHCPKASGELKDMKGTSTGGSN